MNLCFCDVETTGLDPAKDAIIEIALIRDNVEIVYWVELTAVELQHANTKALQVNRYYERAASPGKTPEIKVIPSPDTVYQSLFPQEYQHNNRTKCAVNIARFTADCVLAGNTVKFDQQFLEAWLRRHGACPVWDYHIVDVPTYCAGWLAKATAQEDTEWSKETQELLRPPFKSSNIAEALNLPEMDEEDKHTALGDARRAKDMWETVTS